MSITMGFKVELPQSDRAAGALIDMLDALGYKPYRNKTDSVEYAKKLKREGWNFLYIERGEYVGANKNNSLRTGTIDEILNFKGPKLVKLNDTYSAEVTKEKIKVGCQTFTFEAFDELAEAVKEMRN